jgi:hypothetical protein
MVGNPSIEFWLEKARGWKSKLTMGTIKIILN